jgi:hypothetical protein
MSEIIRKLSFYERLNKLQSELKVPKDQKNNFGNYKYRSYEDIQEKAKPFLKEYFLISILSDDIVLVGERTYIKSTATLIDALGSDKEFANGYAREPYQKKGMDESQITGAASSYARKSALCGLYGIDDNKDSDSFNDHKEKPTEKVYNELLDKLNICENQEQLDLWTKNNSEKISFLKSASNEDAKKLGKIFAKIQNEFKNN